MLERHARRERALERVRVLHAPVFDEVVEVLARHDPLGDGADYREAVAEALCLFVKAERAEEMARALVWAFEYCFEPLDERPEVVEAVDRAADEVWAAWKRHLASLASGVAGEEEVPGASAEGPARRVVLRWVYRESRAEHRHQTREPDPRWRKECGFES